MSDDRAQIGPQILDGLNEVIQGRNANTLRCAVEAATNHIKMANAWVPIRKNMLGVKAESGENRGTAANPMIIMSTA